jgi:hypothetical protein
MRGFPAIGPKFSSSTSRIGASLIGVGLMEHPANPFKWMTRLPKGEHHELRSI